MSLDFSALYTSLYARAATDSAGATLRALLGGASSLFRRTLLAANSDPNNPSRPALPWLVWSPGEVVGESGARRDVGCSWWLYVDPDAASSEATAHSITAAVDALYGHTARYSITGARTYVSFIGPIRPDATLGGLLGREIRITLTQRG
ncbi:MAG TPA: hypothetical protein VF909_16695 [Roseiflexaceae bacterium]